MTPLTSSITHSVVGSDYSWRVTMDLVSSTARMSYPNLIVHPHSHSFVVQNVERAPSQGARLTHSSGKLSQSSQGNESMGLSGMGAAAGSGHGSGAWSATGPGTGSACSCTAAGSATTSKWLSRFGAAEETAVCVSTTASGLGYWIRVAKEAAACVSATFSLSSSLLPLSSSRCSLCKVICAGTRGEVPASCVWRAVVGA